MALSSTRRAMSIASLLSSRAQRGTFPVAVKAPRFARGDSRTRSPRQSVPHVPPICLPEAAHRGFGGARRLAIRRAAAHLDDRDLLAGRRGAALHETADAAILHRDEAGRADQVLLLQAPPVHFRRVVLEAEVGPHQVHLADPT